MIGATVIALGLLLRLAVLPAVEHWQGLREVASLGEARLNGVQQKLDRRDALVARQRVRFGAGVEKPLEAVDRVQVSFPQAVQKALGQGGLGVSSVEPQGVRKLREAPGVVMVSLRVRCGGGPDALPQALASIHKAEQLIIVDQFEVSMAKLDDRAKWSVNMVLSTPALEAQGP